MCVTMSTCYYVLSLTMVRNTSAQKRQDNHLATALTMMDAKSSLSQETKVPSETKTNFTHEKSSNQKGLSDFCNYTNLEFSIGFQYNKTLDKVLLQECQTKHKKHSSTKYDYLVTKNGEIKIKTRCGGVVIAQPVSVNKLKSPVIHKIEKYKVPNIIHYVMYGPDPFSFLNHLSVLSASKYTKPDAIFIHGTMRHGRWWNKTIEEVNNVYFVAWEQPVYIQGREIHYVQHASDILRLHILLGMYYSL